MRSPTSSRLSTRLSGRGWPPAFPVVQFPNPPLAVALAASLAGHLTHATTHRVSEAVFFTSLSVWAYEEAVRGENWFRRLLGVGAGGYILVSLTAALHAA
jgi:hypothetical protein